MEPIVRKILVVGGNGFVGESRRQLSSLYKQCNLITSFVVGSAVCRAALARGYQVTSIRCVHVHTSRVSLTRYLFPNPHSRFCACACAVYIGKRRLIIRLLPLIERRVAHLEDHTQPRKGTLPPGRLKCGLVPSVYATLVADACFIVPSFIFSIHPFTVHHTVIR